MAARRPTRTSKKSYRCVRGFSYPASQNIRDRIRGGDHMPLDERGEWQRHAEGDRITDPPSDLIEDWLQRGIVEPSGAATKNVTEVSDDA